MKKKILTILSVALVVMICILTCGCSEEELESLEGKSADEVIEKAEAMLSEAKNYKATQKTDMGEYGTFDSFTVVYGDKFYSKTTTESEELSSLNSEGWFFEDVSYMESSGMKMKLTKNYTELKELFGLNFSEDASVLFNINKDWFKKSVVEKVDGVYVAEATVDGEMYKEALEDSYFGNLVDAGYEISDIEFKAYFDEEGVLEKVNCEMSLSIQEITIKASTETSIDINVSESDFPELPEDIESWTDYTELIEQYLK